MIRALSPALEAALMLECARLGVRPAITRNAPVSLTDLQAANPRDLRAGRIPVSGEHADRTIWSGPAVNAYFRAWHDTIHLRLAAGFDAVDEYRVARASLYLARTPRDRAIMWAETWGQVARFVRTGAFPENQRAFVARCAGVAP